MNEKEAAQVLAACAAYDQRRPDPAQAQAWAAALDPVLSVPYAVAIVARHYANSRDWIMPADINRAATDLRRRRVKEFKATHGDVVPEGLGALEDAHVELTWRKALLTAVAAGATREQAEAYAWQTIGRTPPPAQPLITRAAFLKTQLAQIGTNP